MSCRHLMPALLVDALPMNAATTFSRACILAAAGALVTLQAGCTSALTTAYLRDGLWAASEHAASAPEGSLPDRDDASETREQADPVAPAPVVDRERREAALEEAMTRLSHLGTLDPAVEAALVATLQRTQPEDWPVVVEEFAGSLATAGIAASAPAPMAITAGRPADGPTAAPAHEPEPEREPDASAEPTAVTEAEPAFVEPAETVPAAAQAEAPVPVEQAVPAITEPAVAVPEATAVQEQPLAVRSACFASAVRAWGDVDRFAADRFHPGQDVIVYVELDNLSAGASPAGHTTCIDAVLRLVDDAGATLHTWSFDPVAETSPARRRDYFARYVLRVPESAPAGSCRVEVDVIDTRSGSTARAAIPLEIAAAD